MADSSHGIFGKRRLTPGQLRSVAERRFDDAICLFESGAAARTNGAMYLGGFVIECLLKALLLERHSNLQSKVDPAKLSSSDKEVFRLLFTSHELDAMLAFLPEVESKLKALQLSGVPAIWERFRAVCEQWTVYARYSPKLADREDARAFLDTIREVKQWLKEL
jgi:hypothetical protein